jgi:hypothetical protein
MIEEIFLSMLIFPDAQLAHLGVWAFAFGALGTWIYLRKMRNPKDTG